MSTEFANAQLFGPKFVYGQIDDFHCLRDPGPGLNLSCSFFSEQLKNMEEHVAIYGSEYPLKNYEK